jgi:hypothetical protein
MANGRAWIVGAAAVLGLAVLIAFGSGHRSDYGRVRSAVGARATVESTTPVRPTAPHHGR